MTQSKRYAGAILTFLLDAIRANYRLLQKKQEKRTVQQCLKLMHTASVLHVSFQFLRLPAFFSVRMFILVWCVQERRYMALIY